MNNKVDESVITIENMSLNYDSVTGVTKVLNDINLSILKQEFVCILGASGCGKTSLLNIIAGIIEPSEGEVFQQNERIKGMSSERGIVFQDANLFPWLNVRDNITFGLKMRGVKKQVIEEKVAKVISTIGLRGYENKYAYELSGGMKQRVSIARILVNDPKIILMDEPFCSLDAVSRDYMQGLVRKVWYELKKTVVFITHDVEEALMLGTRIIVLNGKPATIVEDIRCKYTYDFLQDATEKSKYSQEFYELKQKLISEIL